MSEAACHLSASQSVISSLVTTDAGPKLPRISEVAGQDADNNSISSCLLTPRGTSSPPNAFGFLDFIGGDDDAVAVVVTEADAEAVTEAEAEANDCIISFSSTWGILYVAATKSGGGLNEPRICSLSESFPILLLLNSRCIDLAFL